MYQHSLYGNTTLSGIRKAADDTALGCEFDVRVLMDDDSCVPSELKRDMLLTCLRLECPAYGTTAGKGQHLEAIIAHDQRGIFIGHGKDVQSPSRPSGFMHAFGEHEGGQRRLGSGL